MQIPKIAWTIIAVVLIIMGTFNILAVTQDPHAFEGVDNPPNLTKGIIFLISGLVYFALLIVRKYKNKKARIEGEDIS